MNPLLLNHMIGFSLIAIVLPSIAALVYFNRPKNSLNQLFAVYSLAIAWWAFFTIFMIFSPSPKWGLFWDRLCLTGVVFIPSTLFHFIVAYTTDNLRLKLLIRTNYFVSLFFLAILWFTHLFVSGVQPRFGMKYFTVPGYLYVSYVAFFVLTVIIAMFYLRRFAKNSTHLKIRKQATFLFWFSVIGYTGGSCNYLLVYDINLPAVAEVSNYGVLMHWLVVAYLIFRYRFLDIEVIIRKTLVFAGLFSFAFGIFGFVTFLTQELLSAYITGRAGRILSLGISVFLIVIAYDPLRNFLVNTTDRFLFQKKYDYRKLLRDASAGIAQIKSLHQLLSLVTHFVTMRIRVKNAAILVHDEKSNYFRLAYMRGYAGKGWLQKGHVFNEDDPLIDYLAREHTPLDIERVKEWAESGGQKAEGRRQNKKRSYDFKAIRARMEELQAACCVPSFLGERFRNVLILGEKKSGDFYSDEDLNVLYTLAQESAIAIENARLYDQAVEKAKELEAINDQLNTAQTNLLRALNETEIANKRLRDTHAQLIHEQKMATLGRLASSVGHEVNNPLTILSMNVSRSILKYRHNPDLKVSEIMDIFQKMEQNISRIKAVVNTLTGLLKKSEKGKFEPLSLKLVLEETLPLVQFQTYLENLTGTEVTFDVPANTPLIKGDLERLQEVFLNLFINAYHAMEGKRDRKILVTARENPAYPAMVVIEFTDNGVGMNDEIMRKVFNYGFTTKPAGKGSGMGLYMCRYIIELHGGEIKVRSKLGEGTTFVITLPIYYEPTSLASGDSAGQ